MNTPDNIYLIDMGDQIVWSDTPAPDDEINPDESVAYVREDIADRRIKELEGALAETFEQVYDNAHIDALVGRVLNEA